MSINVEILGGSLFVQHYIEEVARPDHLRLASTSDVFTPTGRTKIGVIWDLTDYIEECRRLLGARRCVGSTFTSADNRLAASLFERNVPIEYVEHAVLLGCARKYVTLINHQSGDQIMSFSYFENVIEEVRELKMSPEYWRHLQMRVDGLEQQWKHMKVSAVPKCAYSCRNEH